MRVLFLHKNFPAQFRHLAAAFAADERNQVVFGTARRDLSLPGVSLAYFSDQAEPAKTTHTANRTVDKALQLGLNAYHMCRDLEAKHFVPDLVVAHSGWGSSFFIRDLFPHARWVGYFEWYYRARSRLYEFHKESPLSDGAVATTRVRNIPILNDLYACDAGLSPTEWQREQFPEVYHDKITVRHDGIDTDFFSPVPAGENAAKQALGPLTRRLSEASEIVTYVARGMEPIRGFPQFMQAATELLRRRPGCHIVVVGEDRVAYGEPRKDGRSFKEALVEDLQPDLDRLHFTGYLDQASYRQVLRHSDVHVYLTWPFVLSWSTLEAMSTGCLLVASDTEPVREVIRDGENGLLVDFFDVAAIVSKIEESLDAGDKLDPLRKAARDTILERHALRDVLPAHLAWLEQML